MEQDNKIKQNQCLFNQAEEQISENAQMLELNDEANDSMHYDKNQGNWTIEDINHLIERNNKFGRQWRKIALDFEGKSARQCAYMYDKISASRTDEKFNRVDDIFLLDLVKMHGYNWQLIQTQMPKFSVIQLKNRYNKVLLAKILNNKTKRRKISSCKLYKYCLKRKVSNKGKVNAVKKDANSFKEGNQLIQSDDNFELKQKICGVREDKVSVGKEHCFENIHEELIKKVNTSFNKVKVILKLLLNENKKLENKYQCKELKLFNRLLLQKMKRILIVCQQMSTSNQSLSESIKTMNELIKNQLLLIQLGKINSKLYKKLSGLFEAFNFNLMK